VIIWYNKIIYIIFLMANKETEKPNLTIKQKLLAVFLAVFAVAVIFLWITDLKSSLSVNYTQSNSSNSGQEEELCLSGNCNEESRDYSDSDGDGLLDWEEKEKYQTSPYLEDSDGDGYTDKEEIESGHDPNCPRGEDCYDSSEELMNNKENNNTEVSTSSGLGNIGESKDSDSENSNINQETQQIMEGEASPRALREVLLQAGMEKEVLNSLSDEELMRAYQETLNKNQN